jgi:uncharacterized protein (DUF736 family)
MNYNTKSYDNTNSGILFSNSDDWIITQQGKINIGNGDERVIAVQRNNKDGVPILELYKAMGTLKKNEDKQKDDHPDAKGVINVLNNVKSMVISAWKKSNDKGNNYISLSLKDFDDGSNVKKNVDDKETNNPF